MLAALQTVQTCCTSLAEMCGHFPCSCVNCCCLYAGTAAGLVALFGVIKVITRGETVEIVGGDEAECRKIADLLSAARYRVSVPERFAFGPIVVDARQLRLTRPDGSVENLKPRELKMLRLFHARLGEVLSRDELLRVCWGFRYWGTTRTVDQHVANLRKKLGPAITLESVRSEGYRISAP